MAWLPSHQSLRSHPKTRKAARRAGVSVPTMIGHLHLLWYWALDLADDGDLSRFDDEDLADAAGWEHDPATFVSALLECGSGGGEGFLNRDRTLHDWDEYGGKYGKRRESARKAAAARWHSDTDPDALPPDSDRNATAVRPHSAGNAEERRREEKREQTPETTTSDLQTDVSDEARQLTRQFAQAIKANGHAVPEPKRKAHGVWLTEMDRLLRIGPPGWDGEPPTVDEVATVIRWATSDEFERANIQSVPKLRKRYSQLRLKAVNTSARGSPKGAEYANRYRQAAAELERQGR